MAFLCSQSDRWHSPVHFLNSTGPLYFPSAVLARWLPGFGRRIVADYFQQTSAQTRTGDISGRIFFVFTAKIYRAKSLGIYIQNAQSRY
ncbi:hypothetical protein [Dyadobacter pollutisoli]|uniref:hypothetical protein n=1 Tax=Dyadobacter pollutisoli TaxID=2910158 RepID=UPI001FD50502|nr:hypothetical protein [Dyadobacter pollutisoli]